MSFLPENKTKRKWYLALIAVTCVLFMAGSTLSQYGVSDAAMMMTACIVGVLLVNALIILVGWTGLLVLRASKTSRTTTTQVVKHRRADVIVPSLVVALALFVPMPYMPPLIVIVALADPLYIILPVVLVYAILIAYGYHLAKIYHDKQYVIWPAAIAVVTLLGSVGVSL